MSASSPTENHNPESRLLAEAIDHTKLTFQADEDETAAITQLCAEARQFSFYSVCVRPRHVRLCKRQLAESAVKVATVIGFPAQKVQLAQELMQPTVGNIPLAEKLAETRQALQNGADELDLVIQVAQLKQDVKNGTQKAREELLAVREAAQSVPIKVIVETDLLSDLEIIQISQWCAETGMFMVKTSTGMVEGGQGATLHAVGLIQETLRRLDAPTRIKASGGIKTRSQALAMLEAGASRLGTSSGIPIAQGQSEAISTGY